MDANALTFEVAGSSGVLYVIQAKRNGDRLSVTCTCDAGTKGMACKHRLALLAGNGAAVVSGNGVEADVLASWLPGTSLAAQFSALAEAEKAAEAAKREVSKAKKALGRIMDGR